MKVTIFHNVARECRRCGAPVKLIGDQAVHITTPAGLHVASLTLANFDGYKPGQPIVRVFETEVEDGTDPYEVAGWMFEAFNAPEDSLAEPLLSMAREYRARQLRSLSVGDVVAAGETPLVCARVGWELLAGAVNEVQVGDHGSVPLGTTA